jgi:hypothetical protein
MTQHTTRDWPIGGFCLAYAGLMGGLLLVGLPFIDGHRLQVLLYWMLPLTVGGVATIAFERTQPIDPD